MYKYFNSLLNGIAKKFSEDSSKMIIWTGVAGWILSSLAQAGAVIFSKKFDDKEKSFLLPQEVMDAAANIGLFFVCTMLTKKIVSKAFSTGKITSNSVRKFINQNSELFKDKIGKIDFDLGKVLETASPKLFKNYEITKNFGTAFATVCSGLIATNIATPVIRNHTAARAQKKFIDYKNNTALYPQNNVNMRI